ncbi:ATP-binding protein [Streptomyces sp. WMMC897]|uniref:ATP-binding protein n=1 Tax=Streptomyces sp. WMMC897 TaxID=3014782 RepID=UPI0022B72B9C|nr:ATP-binding protein [Streptomyces sp. WMMC897]MCZ7416782.1 ATP-binding protein [Streptomyces sp. WMMC897]
MTLYSASDHLKPTTEPPDQWALGLQLTNDPRAPGIARSTLKAAMVNFGLGSDVTQTALLLASELVTNGVKHSDGPVFIRATARKGDLRVSVWDSDPELPEPLTVGTEEPFGRGLLLVELLSRAWGRYSFGSESRGGAAPGKVVWFELGS